MAKTFEQYANESIQSFAARVAGACPDDATVIRGDDGKLHLVSSSVIVDENQIEYSRFGAMLEEFPQLADLV